MMYRLIFMRYILEKKYIKQTSYVRLDDSIPVSCIQVFPWLSSRIQPSGSFKDILPSLCNNITARLDEQEEELENTCLRQCQLGFNINITTKFTYSNLAFRV